VRDHAGAVGVPIPGGAFDIRDVGDPREGVGELVYRGPNVMMGYAEGPADLARGRDTDALATGDLGRRLPSGLYEVVGRASRFIKVVGLRVDLAQVEALLLDTGVRAACTGEDERLVVGVEGVPDDDVAGALATRLGIPRCRVDVVVLDAVPRLPTGKPDYASVLERAGAPTSAGPGATCDIPAAGACGAAVLVRLIDAVEGVLGVTGVRPSDSFARLGGDSLSYVEMSLAVERVLGTLPDGWADMPLADLAGARTDRSRRLARMETNVVLRAGAIMLIVAAHMTDFWPGGGAHLLLALAGFSFARFQLGDGSRARLARWGALIGRIAIPASLWIGAWLVLTGTYSVGAAVLVNNYTGDAALTNRRWEYWFIEALVQVLIVLAVLFAIPGVRALERRRPFAFAVGVLGVLLIVRFALAPLAGDVNAVFMPHWVAWVFALGWVVQRARTSGQRMMATILVVALIPGFFDDPVREGVVAGGLLLAAWVPSLPVPRPLTGLIGVIGAASLYIYLVHWQVWPPVAGALGVPGAFAASIAAGVGAWWVVGGARPAAMWRSRITSLVRSARAASLTGATRSPAVRAYRAWSPRAASLWRARGRRR
jgi:hypothetical protein